MFVGAGFFLGNLPVVKHNFTLVVLGIVAVSLSTLALKRYCWCGQARRLEQCDSGDSSDSQAHSDMHPWSSRGGCLSSKP